MRRAAAGAAMAGRDGLLTIDSTDLPIPSAACPLSDSVSLSLGVRAGNVHEKVACGHRDAGRGEKKAPQQRAFWSDRSVSRFPLPARGTPW